KRRDLPEAQSMIGRTSATLLLAFMFPLSLGRGDQGVRTGPVPDPLLAGFSWRNLGPFRSGRVSAVSGAIGQPGTFYAGFPVGGVWKTTSAGETWYPVFDAVKEASSVGAIAVAPSNPDVIYVGMGDLITGGGPNEGNGVYKSSDAGRTWQHVGLDQTKQIPSLLVDPKNPDLVLLAAQGDVHKKSDTRGVYRSTYGGRSWTRRSMWTTRPARRRSRGPMTSPASCSRPPCATGIRRRRVRRVSWLQEAEAVQGRQGAAAKRICSSRPTKASPGKK